MEDIDLDVRLEDVWLAHKARRKTVDERQERIDLAVRLIDEDYLPLIYTAHSVELEVKAKALSAGFTINQIEGYIERKHAEGHPPMNPQGTPRWI